MRSAVARTQTPPEEVEQLRRGAGKASSGEWLLCPPPGLPAQAKKHAESAKDTLLTWKENTTSDKEKKEILEALVMLYYTLGVAWLLQNQYPSLPSRAC
ncbi:Tetratricopeptide Repeat Protein 23-Like [Manis pentadactyla]|nr:Tetratricopeptide Repeat Protein 23-Like [Manis pentadactyla]